MRLSELLQQEDFKKHEIAIIGRLKTEYGVYAVLGKRGQKIMPIVGNTHPIEISEDDPDPEISSAEELSIRRRLDLGTPPIMTSGLHGQEED